MKKILLIVMAFALVLSLCAGCNTGKRVVDDFDDDPEPIVIGGTSDDNSGDKPDDNSGDKPKDDSGDKPEDDSGDKPDVDDPAIDIPEGWPVDNLPPGFPVYPNGEINDLSGEDYTFIVIHNTDQDTFKGYKAELEAWGFEFDEPSSNDIYTGFTDDWEIGLSTAETMVGINLKPNS